FAMVFFAQKVLRKVPGDWSFVVVTDRVELDDQIARTFAACGAVTDAKASHAASGAGLRELLAGNNRYVFTLIQKFQTTDRLSDRRDVVVLTDEAHRSQYDTLALNMRAALPNALFLAFTGTPLIAGEERTKDLFGDYVSIYDFQQSVQDGATVLRMHDKVRAHWTAERTRVAAALGSNGVGDAEREDLARRFDVLATTDMALVVSPGQNEVEQMKALGLDIVPHRKRMNEEKL